jgi:predicted aconitase with swiveling domain
VGAVQAKELVTRGLVAYWAGTDWETGEIVEIGHEAHGKNMAGKILVFPKGKGGAGETFGYNCRAQSGKAPKANYCQSGLGQTVAGALLTGTPMVYGFAEDIVSAIRTGDAVRADTDKGEVEVINRGS